MRFVFDFIIVFLLLFSGYWMYIIVRSFFVIGADKDLTKLWRVILLGLLLFIFGSVFWGSFILPNQILTTRINFNFAQTEGQEKVRIIFLSDLHAGPYKQTAFYAKAVELIMKEKPDAVLLGGDLIDKDEEAASFLAPLENLTKNNIPVYAVTGNHEYQLDYSGRRQTDDRTGLMRELFKKWNIKILENETAQLGGINISGVPDLWTNKADLPTIVKDRPAAAVNLLLVHNPDIILNKNSREFDLILAGHTHAGQFRFPGIGSLAPIPNQLGRRYDYGLFSLGENKNLYITSGIGETGARARYFCHPEIAVIEIDL